MGQTDPAGGDSGSKPGDFLHIEHFERSMAPIVSLPKGPLARRELYSELAACGMCSLRAIEKQLLREGWELKARRLIEQFNDYAEDHSLELRLGDDEQLTALLTSRYAQQILQGLDKKAQKLRPRRIVSIAQLMEKLR